VGLRTEDEVRDAATRIGPPVIVQPMARGVELLAGVVQDQVFGPLVAFGPGRRAGRADRGRRLPDGRR
jgi:acyl-CoA synthetase (NDP forming)